MPAVFESALEIPGYTCEGLVGRGGMGSVYRAVQLSHNRPVAIKVLGEAFRGDPEFVVRFRQEAQLLATLEHPHIVPMLDSGEANGVPYIVMRLVDGPTLRDVARVGGVEQWYAVELLTGIAAALDFAHARGVLHRDVKPHNMLLDQAGHVWLADFGLTRLASQTKGFTSTSRIAGTFDYLAPELAAGQAASAASDVYALAVTSFQLLTGQLPFGAEHAAALLRQHAAAPRPAASSINPSLPTWIDSVLADGMAVEPAARPPSAGELMERLAGAPPVPERARRMRRLSVPALDHVPPLGSSAPPSALTSAETDPSLRTPRRPSWSRPGPARFAAAGALALALATSIALAVAGFLPGRPTAEAALIALRASGRSARTWFDYADAGGRAGPQLVRNARVKVSCRIAAGDGPDGGVWWYRIASQPWDQQFYARATDFTAIDGTGAARPYDPAVPVCSFFAEVPGNRTGTYTWTNYRLAGGLEGRRLPGFVPSKVLCRVRGLKVTDGNVWWYRIGGAPWNGRFYASADAFYNNGETHGTLRGTAFVDKNVPLCSSGG